MKFYGVISALLLASMAHAQEEKQPQTLFTNVHVFDGVNEARIENASVLVEGNLIKSVSTEAIEAPDAAVIDGEGRTLLPGFIDNHVHLALPGPTIPLMETDKTWMDLALHAAAQSEMYLMQGFTTVRDAGGADAGIRRAIDAGIIDGPRVYISAAFIGGRGGHADFASFTAPPNAESNMNRLNIGVDADGVDAVLKAARNNFRMGANQLKVMQSGGVVSSFDPWQMEGRTVQEIEAAVEIAEQYGSYAMAHSYRKDSILRALNAGVRSVEHGFMYDCEIGAVMEEKGAFITTNLTAFDPGLTTIPAIASNPSSLAKALSASAAFTDYLDNMRKCPAKRGHHTDCVGTVGACNIQVAYEKHLAHEFFGAYTSLVAMTSVGGEIAAMTGDFMNPYPDGKLGVIEEGAYADILLIDGNPLEDFSVVGTGDKWFDAEPRPESPETIRVIMKDGVIYKNTLE
ncbi:amidohydrolase family protein [Roseovarius sp. EL26]|uniref:amidohydrolase family protein n=1 Tax=Roseovarius sp. EL26 TaxID=2126672 RepID=UPI000EA0BA28|nr:amidohydrolase family protein [Roseovarius sp. EL26]